jgi:AmmeMemoRadiSam system protein B
MSFAKQPNVAGSFYPAKQLTLQQTGIDFLAAAPQVTNTSLPKAMIVPHAGYVYSGSIAAAAYKPFLKSKNKVSTIVLIGPAHFVPFFGIATTYADSFITPLGAIDVDQQIVRTALQLKQVVELDVAFQKEHCLEVQLPFISQVLPHCKIVPFLVGNTSYQEVAELIKKIWGGPETLIIISSDLSHYHNYETANKLDQETSLAIENLQIEKMSPNSACGKLAIQGLLQCAVDFNLKVIKLDLKNSGDTAGDRTRVVGYGAYHLC